MMQYHLSQILKEGNILDGDFWPEAVRVIALKKIGRGRRDQPSHSLEMLKVYVVDRYGVPRVVRKEVAKGVEELET